MLSHVKRIICMSGTVLEFFYIVLFNSVVWGRKNTATRPRGVIASFGAAQL
jgi:hypothetical protein